MTKQTILVITAHDDDNVFGMGGTILKYVDEGHKVISVIISFGEGSNPWLKGRYVKSKRMKEWKEVEKYMGITKSYYLGLTETKFKKEFPKKQKELENIIKKYKPSKIFTHSSTDAHPDHRDTLKIVKKTMKKLNLKIPIYCFEVWTLLQWKKNIPASYIDITKTFKKKMKMLKLFKSQLHVRFFLNWSIYMRAIFNGFSTGYRFAERFTIER